MNLTPHSLPPLILRVGLGAVVLWFGLQQLFDASAWTAWVPEWVAALGLSPLTVVYVNGGFETIASLLLILGVFVRPLALLLFLHMMVLVVEIGLTPIGVRDFGIAVGFLALALYDAPRHLIPKEIS